MTSERVDLPSELGLRLRMLVAFTVAAAGVAAAAFGIAYVALKYQLGWLLAVYTGGILLSGLGAATRRPRCPRKSRQPEKGDKPRVDAGLQRLALVAGVAAPKVSIERQLVPLTWTTAMPWKTPTLHVTTGLLDELDDSKLHAVLAHELAHVVHRDALLMTLVAGPPSYLLAGLRQEVDDADRGADYGDKFWTRIYVIVLGPPAALLLAVARIVSRNREFAADRAAALLIGSPARVASALIAVEQRLDLMPSKDLRAVAVRDAFHFVAARSPRWWERPWATHPESSARVESLQRLESAAQQGAHLGPKTSGWTGPAAVAALAVLAGLNVAAFSLWPGSPSTFAVLAVDVLCVGFVARSLRAGRC